MKLPDKGTNGEIYGPAMDVQTPEEAKEYFEALVQRYIRLTGDSDEEAARIVRINVGYYAGYYDPETSERVYRLYGFGHPFFGTMQPTNEQLLNMGIAYGALKSASEKDIDIEAFGRVVQQGMKEVEDR